jgi:RNase P subunit RPR2
MMRQMRSDDGGIRVECLRCGAHTRVSRGDYRNSLEKGNTLWCSTCGSFHKVQEGDGDARATARDRAPSRIPLAPGDPLPRWRARRT